VIHSGLSEMLELAPPNGYLLLPLGANLPYSLEQTRRVL